MASLDDRLRSAREEVEECLRSATDEASLREVEARVLGEKGLISRLAAESRDLLPEDRRAADRTITQFKEECGSLIEARRQALKDIERELEATRHVDVTLPGTALPRGSLHPVTLVTAEVVDILTRMGFEVFDDYNEVDDEDRNFDALNFPQDHPARDQQNPIWLDTGQLLRTHSSGGQIRLLRKRKPPLKAIIPARCFRNDPPAPNRDTTFFQLEGIMVDKGLSLSHMLAVIIDVIHHILKKKVRRRVRTGFFPFVKPGLEIDVQCLGCTGDGCATCRQRGWIELLPCGMIHPNVLRACGREDYSGFAFGLGLTRLAMIKYGIPDIKHMHSCDLEFLTQFGTTWDKE